MFTHFFLFIISSLFVNFRRNFGLENYGKLKKKKKNRQKPLWENEPLGFPFMEKTLSKQVNLEKIKEKKEKVKTLHFTLREKEMRFLLFNLFFFLAFISISYCAGNITSFPTDFIGTIEGSFPLTFTTSMFLYFF